MDGCSCLFYQLFILFIIISIFLHSSLALPDVLQRSIQDPEQDFIDDVSESEWREWESHGILPVNATIAQLVSKVGVQWPLSIHVRFVGWGGAAVANVRGSKLPPVKVFGRALGSPATDGHALTSVPLHVTYSSAPPALRQALEAARDAQLAVNPTRFPELNAEPLETLLHADLEAHSSAASSWFLYVLNLTRVPDTHYLYHAEPCATPLMVSERARMGWIDQGAGPTDWGPVVAGVGHVDLRHLPLVPDPPPADLLAFVHRTAAILLAPSVHLVRPSALLPLPLIVRLLHVRSSSTSAAQPWSAAAIKGVVQAATGASESDVQVESRVVLLSDWPAGAAALTTALRTRTSAYHSDEQLRVTVHPYIDAQLLAKGLRNVLAAHDPPPKGEQRVVRAVLFDVGGSEPLLLDRLHQAMALSHDLVLAVQTNVSRLSVDAQCGHRSLSLDARNATRSLVAALLDAVTGLAPQEHLLRPRGAGEEDALEWSAGRAFSGPYSAYIGRLVPTTADAAQRAVIVQLANVTLTRLAHVAAQPELDEEPTSLLSQRQAKQLRRRLLLLRYLWITAATALTNLNHAAALALTRAATAEGERVAMLALKAAYALRSQLACPAPRAFAWERALLLLSSVFLSSASGAYYYTVRKRMPNR